MNPAVTIHLPCVGSVPVPLRAPANVEHQTPAGQASLSLTPQFIAQAPANTLRAFVGPTVAAPLLPQHLRFAGPIGSGLIYAYLHTHPSELTFDPEPSRSQALTASGIAIAPFLGAIPMHEHLRHMPQLAPLAASSAARWDACWSACGGSFGEQMRRYPGPFVAGRVAAQLTAASIGGVLQHAYLSRVTGGTVRRRDTDDVDGLEPAGIDPTCEGAAAGLFALPAALGSPPGMNLLRRAGLPPAAQTGVVVSALVGAAIGTKAVALTHTTA